jgi:putative endonuclease
VDVRSAVGLFGEQVAARYLERHGLVLLDRRWRCARGEIDIVAADQRCLVVCEVKTRRSLAAGSPAEAVTVRKLGRLRLLTGLWLAEHDATWQEVRIDVVSVVIPRRGAPLVEHLRAVG